MAAKSFERQYSEVAGIHQQKHNVQIFK